MTTILTPGLKPVPVRCRDQCLFCTSNSCYTAIFTADRRFDEVACGSHVEHLHNYANLILGNPGLERTHVSSAGRMARKRMPIARTTWKNYLLRLRGCGRTTLMFAQARALAMDGYHVNIVCNDTRHCTQMRHVFGTDFPEVEFHSASDQRMDWERLRFIDGHSLSVTLVDHYVLEERYARMLEMLHRYDP